MKRTIHIQTQEYLHKNGVLYKYQTGFRANVSTGSCLVQPTDFIFRRMDKNFHTGLILIDPQKGFDTLDHTLLLQKMECIGFQESVINWFAS